MFKIMGEDEIVWVVSVDGEVKKVKDLVFFEFLVIRGILIFRIKWERRS